jgi:hypothetical protein
MRAMRGSKSDLKYIWSMQIALERKWSFSRYIWFDLTAFASPPETGCEPHNAINIQPEKIVILPIRHK